MKKIVIATRGSALALWQAEYIGSRLPADRAAGILILKTKGDVLLDAPLAQLGGKGLFVKEIEDALLDGRADLAVHSMKDVPMALPPGLTLAAMPERGASGDLFLSERFPCLDAMPEGAALGTSSLRRQAQALALRPDLTVTMLRGNVETRLRKMKEGRFDAIILAEAGMVRLGLGAKYHEALTLPRFVSAVGQGALGVEIREDRRDLARLLAGLDHGPTRLCVEAERAFLAGLNGGCQTPIGGRAELKDGDLILEGMVAAPDGGLVLRRAMRSRAGDAAAARDLGRSLAEAMLAGGAKTILDSLYARGDSTL